MQIKEYTLRVGEKDLTAQFTDLADQANGSVILRYGNTAVLATAVMSDEEKEGMSYFPLTVDYEEKFYAAGAILGSRFVRREGRPSDEAVLSGRVVDRTIRPLFNHQMRNEIQVIITILSIDEDDPDILAINAASLALGTSNIPWNGPVSAVRIGKNKEGSTPAINPSYFYRDTPEFAFDLTACGKDGNINMIEFGGNEIQEIVVTEALQKASEEIEKIQVWQKNIISELGKEKKSIGKKETSQDITKLFENRIKPKLSAAVFSGPGKNGIKELHKEWGALVGTELPEVRAQEAADYYEEKVSEIIHEEAIENRKRPDGRKVDEIRPLYAKAGGISPVLHGSGIFYRGGTHVFSALTLGGPGDTQLIDSMEERDTKKRFIHHYNFPPFAPGETGRIGGFNRRMIGHGALVEKALLPIIPSDEKFPYTIRLVSECMASNGSTSMGSVCAATLALMDGGVPIVRPVAGIASGLMMRDEKHYQVLTDIQGPEDEHGDMDFKVAGTREGITAIQMDVKVSGIPHTILQEAFDAARKARLYILDTLEKEISTPRASISPRAPEILSLQIKQDQIGMIIGPGGKTINKIRDDTGVDDITIEDTGMVFITGKNSTAAKAQEIIASMTREYLPGETFEGEVTRVTDFGAFVKIGTNTEGLVHVSEIAPFRISNVRDVLKEGDKVPVIIKEIDEKNRINLSIKNVDATFAERKNPSLKK